MSELIWNYLLLASEYSPHREEMLYVLKDISYYKPDWFECMKRVSDFYKSKPGAPIALINTFPSVLSIKGPILEEYDFENDLDKYVDDFLTYQEELFEVRANIKDDWIPSVVPYLGISEFSAFISGEITFGRDTSWVDPVLRERSDLNLLKLDPQNKWFKILSMYTEFTLERIFKFRIPFARGYYSPLDLAWALRGEKIYSDFYDDPKWVHSLLKFCLDATEWFARSQINIILSPKYTHILSNWYCAQNRIAVSEDISSLCSPEHYKTFGKPYTQKLFERFGLGEIHCHSSGSHQLENFLDMKPVRQIQIVADPNQQRPVHILSELIDAKPYLFGKDQSHPVIIVDATPSEAVEFLELGRFMKISFSVVTETREEAIEAVELFRTKQEKIEKKLRKGTSL